MRHSVTIGVKAKYVAVVTNAIHDLMGWESEPHDSLYLGEYDLFHAPEKMMVKYNFVEAEGEWDLPDHPHFPVLIVVGETERPEFFRDMVANLGFETEVISDKPW